MGSAARSSVAVSADGKSVYVASYGQRRRGALQPQHDHRGDHPARRDRRLRRARRGRGRAPTAMGSTARRRWRSAPTGRASTSPPSSATPWRASTGRPEPACAEAMGERSGERSGSRRSLGATGAPAGGGALAGGPGAARVTAAALAVTGDLTQPAGTPPAASARRGRGPAPTAMGSTRPDSVAVSADGKSVYVAYDRAAAGRRGAPQPQARPPGRSPSPPGPPAASARRGRGPAPTAMRSTTRARWRSAPTGRASTSPPRATPWRASTATRPPGRSPSPPGRRLRQRGGAGTAPTAMGSRRERGGGSADGKSVYVGRGSPWRASPQHDHRGDRPARRGRRLRQRDGRVPAPTAYGPRPPTSVAVSA